MVQSKIDIAHELALKNYEEIINYADETQKELIHNWHVKNSKVVEKLILFSRNILNIWYDSVVKKRLWVALIRCGAWIGTLETIERSIYEENMNLWSEERLYKKISSIKHLPEIVRLLEVRGVMNHSEMVEELKLNNSSTLTEILKKTLDMELIDVRKAGRYNLYSLTDAGVRYARQMRAGKGEQNLLKNIIREYKLQMTESTLDLYLRSFDYMLPVKQGQVLKVSVNDERLKHYEVDKAFKYMEDDRESGYLSLKMLKTVKEDLFSYEREA